MKKNITVIIFACNDELNIKDCINSVKLLTDNILLIDIGSNDRTSAIAESCGIGIYKTQYKKYVELVREDGIKQSKTRWVFIIDADERLTDETVLEIKDRIKSNYYSYYKIPRRNIFDGKKWLRFGFWWPDYQIRLIDIKYFKKWPKQIHSNPVIEGKYDILKNPLIHNFHGNIENMVEKTILFEDIESDLLYKADKKTNVFIFIKKFIGELYRRILKGMGFLDGTIGIIEGIYQAFSKTITYIFLYEKKKNRSL